MRFVATLLCIAVAASYAPPAAAQAYASTDTPLVVADGAVGGTVCGDPGTPTVSTITVPAGGGTIADLNVIVNIAATWVGDVTATLSNGTHTAVLIDRPGATTPDACGDSSNDYPSIVIDDEGTDGTVEDAPTSAPTTSDIAYTEGGSYTPNEPLSVFDGDPLEGTWTLTVTDGGEGDDTSLLSWQLLFNDSPPVAAEPAPLPQGYAFELDGPNPFVEATRFELRVGETEPVRVAVYDVRGREVALLHDGPVAADSPIAVPFAREALQAGTYLVRAEGASFSASRQVAVLR